MNVGVTFPAANHRGGVERVVWELLRFLSADHETSFIGRAMDPRIESVHHVEVHPKPAPRAVHPYAFRRAASHALRRHRPGRLVSFGVECPPGNVFWVQSVHRSWLEQSSAQNLGGLTVPAAARQLLPRHRALLRLEREYFTASSPEWILCTSHREIQDLVRLYGVDADKCVVAPNGYDRARFNVANRQRDRDAERARLGIAPSDVVALFVANELHRKGFGQLIEAVERIGRCEMRVEVVGRVDSRPYTARIRELGLHDRVRFHGSTDRVEKFHAAADLLVLPTHYEPFGMVIIEAMASGLPVVASSIAGAAKAISDGNSGLLVNDPNDVAELTSHLSQLLDVDRRSEMGDAAVSAARPYEWQSIFAAVQPRILGETSNFAQGELAP